MLVLKHYQYFSTFPYTFPYAALYTFFPVQAETSPWKLDREWVETKKVENQKSRCKQREHSLEFNYVVLIVSCHWIGTAKKGKKERKVFFSGLNAFKEKTSPNNASNFLFTTRNRLQKSSGNGNGKATKWKATTKRKNYTNFPRLYQHALLFGFPRRYLEIEIHLSLSST